MNLKKLFRIKKTRYGVFLEPRYNLNKFEKVEKKIRRRKR